MAEYFAENGQVIPVTLVSLLPVAVKRIFSKEKDGYHSVQVSWGQVKNAKLSIAMRTFMDTLRFWFTLAVLQRA